CLAHGVLGGSVKIGTGDPQQNLLAFSEVRAERAAAVHGFDQGFADLARVEALARSLLSGLASVAATGREYQREAALNGLYGNLADGVIRRSVITGAGDPEENRLGPVQVRAEGPVEVHGFDQGFADLVRIQTVRHCCLPLRLSRGIRQDPQL